MTDKENAKHNLDFGVLIANVAVMAFICILIASLPAGETGSAGIVAGVLAWADALYFVARCGNVY